MRLIDADAIVKSELQKHDKKPSDRAWDRFVDIRDAIKAAPTIESPRDWTPCAEGQNLPENKKEVLLSCVGHNKREYVCKGYYIRKHTEEIGAADDIEADWDEVTDTNFLPEGFYECIENWGDYSFVYINDAVLAWQPLPEPYNPDHIRDTTKKVKEA